MTLYNVITPEKHKLKLDNIKITAEYRDIINKVILETFSEKIEFNVDYKKDRDGKEDVEYKTLWLNALKDFERVGWKTAMTRIDESEENNNEQYAVPKYRITILM